MQSRFINLESVISQSQPYRLTQRLVTLAKYIHSNVIVFMPYNGLF